jgi:penicillin-binding protein 1B
LQVWADLLRELPTQGLPMHPPGDVSFDWIDSRTGLLSAELCEDAVWLPLRASQHPTRSVRCRLRRSEQHWWRFWR